MTARVKLLFIGAPGSGMMLRVQMIGKWFVGETGKQVRIGDNLEVADQKCDMSMRWKFYMWNEIGMVKK